MKTDIKLKQDVIAELGWEPSVNAAQIGVEVKDGVVTLAGHVDNYAEKWHAEKAAQRVTGVKALAIEMDVKLAGSSERNDSDIARAAQHAVEWSSILSADDIDIKVEKGWITLSGDVGWNYKKQSATNCVRTLMGVKGITNNISIKSKLSKKAVKADIDAALKRSAKADSDNLIVEVNGSDVTLSGKVHSLTERQLVANSAWATPGVHFVTNNITISS